MVSSINACGYGFAESRVSVSHQQQKQRAAAFAARLHVVVDIEKGTFGMTTDEKLRSSLAAINQFVHVHVEKLTQDQLRVLKKYLIRQLQTSKPIRSLAMKVASVGHSIGVFIINKGIDQKNLVNEAIEVIEKQEPFRATTELLFKKLGWEIERRVNNNLSWGRLRLW